MSLEIVRREADGILLLEVDGRIVLGSGLETLQETVTKELDAGRTKQILNLKKASFIDSSGLGMLVLLHTNLAQKGGVLKLLHLSQRHLELLILTKLTEVFEIFDDEQDAINSFYPEREVRHFDILEFVKSQEEKEPQTIGNTGEVKK